MTTVTFLQDCAEDRAGETKAITPDRAKRLVRTGYARLVEHAVDVPEEDAARPRAQGRGPKPERRG